jgi:ribosome-binding protein aMBF1 (putative translation factor)
MRGDPFPDGSNKLDSRTITALGKNAKPGAIRVSTGYDTICKVSISMKRARDNDELAQIGARLRAARLALGLSQKDLYEAIGVKAAAWNHWESGKRMPDPLAMMELYRLHGVTLEWIYGGDPRGLPFGVARTILKAAS